jgi:hypothetical protein
MLSLCLIRKDQSYLVFHRVDYSRGHRYSPRNVVGKSVKLLVANPISHAAFDLLWGIQTDIGVQVVGGIHSQMQS